MHKARLTACVVVLTAGLSACGAGSSGGSVSAGNTPAGSTHSAGSAEPATKTTIAGISANDHGTKDVTGQKAVSIEADNFYFEPSVLQGAPGQKLTLTIRNEGSTEHNFTVHEQHVDADIDGGKTVTVHVTMPASGVLSFYCEYHKSLGMAGGLLVSGDKAGAAPSATTSESSGTSSGWG